MSASYAYDWLTKRGYTPVQAAGIVGNLVQESGVRPGDGTKGGDGGMSHGIAQWNRERLAGLKDYAAQRDASPWNLDTQLGYLDWELKNKETGAYSKLMRATNVRDATAAMIGFERPQGWTADNPSGGHGWSNRLGNAEKIAAGDFTGFGKGSASDFAGRVSGGGGGGGGGGSSSESISARLDVPGLFGRAQALLTEKTDDPRRQELQGMLRTLFDSPDMRDLAAAYDSRSGQQAPDQAPDAPQGFAQAASPPMEQEPPLPPARPPQTELAQAEAPPTAMGIASSLFGQERGAA